jgi:hypothetical protein
MGGFSSDVAALLPEVPSGREAPTCSDPVEARRARLYPETVALRLGAMRRGQIRSVRLRLTEIARDVRRPSDHYLDVKVCCDRPGELYYLDIKADFGERPPRGATLVLLKSRNDATAPLTLLEGGCPVERGLPLPLLPATSKVVFWVSTEGSPVVPPKLAAEIRVREPEPAAEPERELDTMRLPSAKTAIIAALAEALRRAPTAALRAFGEFLAAPEAAPAAALARLLEAEPDLRLVDAAVHVLDAAELAGTTGTRPVDFPLLCLNEPAEACLAVFHPRTPPYLVNQAFVVALENHLQLPAGSDQATLWRELAKAAAVVLFRADRALLDEDVELMAVGGDASRAHLLRLLVEWASRKQRPPSPPPAERLESSLDRITGADPDQALQTTLDVLLTYGFVGIAARLD